MKIDRAPNPMELLTITVPQEVKPGDMIRSCQEGLINLYSKDGASKTVTSITKKKRGLNLSFLLGDANIIGDQTDFLDLRNPNNRRHTLLEIFSRSVVGVLGHT